MKRIVTLIVPLVTALMLTAVPYGSCASFNYVTKTLENPTTPSGDWLEGLSLDKVDKNDASLGTLTGVEITISAKIGGTLGYEALNSYNTNLAFNNVSGEVDIALPVVGTKSYTNSFGSFTYNSIPHYDGTADWGGSSGAQQNFGIVKTDVVGYTLASDVSWFTKDTGTDPLFLRTTANFNWAATYNGKVLTFFDTKPDISLSVKYIYEVPEPGSMLAFASGLVGLVGLGIRRRK